MDILKRRIIWIFYDFFSKIGNNFFRWFYRVGFVLRWRKWLLCVVSLVCFCLFVFVFLLILFVCVSFPYSSFHFDLSLATDLQQHVSFQIINVIQYYYNICCILKPECLNFKKKKQLIPKKKEIQTNRQIQKQTKKQILRKGHLKNEKKKKMNTSK